MQGTSSYFLNNRKVPNFYFVDKPKAYVPPQLRGLPEATRAKFKEDYEPASNVKQQLAQEAAQQGIYICTLDSDI